MERIHITHATRVSLGILMKDSKERWKQFVHKKDGETKKPSKIQTPPLSTEPAPMVGVQQYTPTSRRNCKHPKEHQLVEIGPLVGRIVICRLCGSNLNDPDLAE